jgi:dolichyl-phosphate beta-glucosyltransferase
VEVYLSVVIPAYNEELRLGPTVRRIKEYLQTQPRETEIVVVDDGSSDATSQVASRYGARALHHPKNLGKGAAIRTAFLSAAGRFILFTDADSSTPIQEADKFLPLLEQGFDLVIGSRRMRTSQVLVRQPRHRELMGKGFQVLASRLLGLGVKDVTCGFKAFRREAAVELARRQKRDDWTFDAEHLCIARALGMGIAEVPVRWENSPASRVRVARDTVRSLTGLLAVWVNKMRGCYGP